MWIFSHLYSDFWSTNVLKCGKKYLWNPKFHQNPLCYDTSGHRRHDNFTVFILNFDKDFNEISLSRTISDPAIDGQILPNIFRT